MTQAMQLLHVCILRFPNGELRYCGDNPAQQQALERIKAGPVTDTDLATIDAVPVVDVSEDEHVDRWSFAFAHSHGKITSASKLAKR